MNIKIQVVQQREKITQGETCLISEKLNERVKVDILNFKMKIKTQVISNRKQYFSSNISRRYQYHSTLLGRYKCW